MALRPILFSLFGLKIYAYGTALALAFLIAIALASREGRRTGLVTPETVIDIALCLCVGGLIGARLLYVLLEFGYYRQNPWEILNIKAGGLSFYGGAIAGFGAAWWYGRRKKLEPWPIADLLVPYAALGYAIVRIGCFLNGCCYGTASHLPWAIACKAGDPLTLRHPTQLYASLGSLILFGILLAFRKHKRFPGFLFFLYAGLYAVMRGVIEGFRESQILFGPVRTTQVACLFMALFAFGVILHKERHRVRMEGLEVKSGEDVGRGA